MDAGPIIIAGAGIGGLTAALALAGAGHEVIVAERRVRLDEAGAGIQLSSNASSILLEMGLGPPLLKAAGEPERLVVRRGDSGHIIVTMPLGEAVRARYGAPHLVIHRADLQLILLDAARANPRIRLAFGRTLVDAHTSGARAVASFETAGGAATLEGHALIGADGLWSRAAPAIGEDSQATACGYVAWRGAVPAERAPPPFRRRETGLWLGAFAHVVHYPVRGDQMINIVAILAEGEAEPGWSRPGDGEAFRRRFKGWSRELTALFAAVEDWQVWSLYDRKPRRRWTAGRVALLGDAAHPVLPFLAQGGALAIEDAAVLAQVLAPRELAPAGAGAPEDVPGALKRYESRRRERAARIQAAARFNGRAYHLPSPLAGARDLVLGGMGGEALLARYDWLYGWTPGKV